MRSRRCLLALWGALVASNCDCGAPPEPPPPAAGPCDELTLDNTVDAAPAVVAATGVASYRYRAPLGETALDLSLYDDGGAALGVMTVEQVFGSSLPDGTMRATLADVVLTERALRLASGARVLRSTLAFAAAPRLFIEATFEDQRCREVDAPAALPCAPAALLSPDDGLIVPSCGLDFDAELVRGALPTLTHLRYRVLVDEAAGAPTVGGRDDTGEAPAWVFDAVFDGELADPDERTAFLEDSGVMAALASDDARRLLAAYPDATWSRLLQQHASHCLTTGAFDDEIEFVAPAQAEQAVNGGTNGNRDTSSYTDSSSRTGGSSRGDPHLTTFDLRSYDLQAKGELVLARSVSGAELPLEVQARFEPLAGAREHALCQSVSYTTAVAARAGDHVVEVRPGLGVQPGLEVLVDGAPLAGAEVTLEGAGEPRLLTSRYELRIAWSDATELVVSGHGRFLNVDMSPGAVTTGRLEGLFGDGDGDPGNDLVLANGALVPSPAPFSVLHGELRASWSVDGDTSLFTYDGGQGFEDFDDPSFPAGPADPSLIPAEERLSLEQTCRERGVDGAHLGDCVIDLFCAEVPAEADDVRGASPPRLQDRPSGVALAGDVVEAGYHGALDTDEPVTGAGCGRYAAGAALLFPEERITLSADLALDGVTVPAGTTLRGYTLFVPARDDGVTVPVVGALRFGRPVLALVEEESGLLQSDVVLPAGVTVTGAGRGVDVPATRGSVDGDGAGVRFVFEQGSDPESIRLLVEEVSP